MKSILLLTTLLLPLQAADPSLEAIRDPTGASRFSERWRILADLDGDGKDDMLLSDSPSTFGNAGGSWTVHLRRDGDWHQVGRIDAHPQAISIEPDQRRILGDPERRRHARIWVYSRASGSAGLLGYYRVGEATVDDFERIEIYPGDGGTDLGRAAYAAVFAHSPIPFKREFSTTDDAGRVSWAPAG